MGHHEQQQEAWSKNVLWRSNSSKSLNTAKFWLEDNYNLVQESDCLPCLFVKSEEFNLFD